jgi:short-subunit dehydrogenase
MPEQRSVLITGAGSGLGLALAKQYAAQGARIALADIRDDRLSQAQEALSGTGHLRIVLDVGSDVAWANALERVRSEWGVLDVLINNAGIASSGDFIDTSMQEWLRVMDINTSSVHRGCSTFLPMLVQSSRAQVINVASFAGLASAPDTGVYGVSKAAVLAYSEILRAQVFARGVKVACLCPSFFQTNLLESFSPGHERMKKTATKLMQAGQMSADDVARYTIEAAERGEFLLLPHRETRIQARIKRWFPGYYFRRLLTFSKRDR